MGKPTRFSRFSSGTFLSRVSGFGRDLATAAIFGDHPSVASFMIAFRFANLLRRLVAEGPIQTTFIPFFEELRLKNPLEATHFFLKLILLFAITLLALTLAVEGFLTYLLTFTLSPSTREILHLSRYLFPAILFICLYGLSSSLLHCYDTFFLPSIAPLLFNLAWIIGVISLKSFDAPSAMPYLAIAVVLGFLMQWLITLPQTLKHLSLKNFTFTLPPEVKLLFKAFALGAIGIGAAQLNTFFDAIFAHMADPRGPVYLWYAVRLQQLALALFGIAAVSTIAPRLSRAIKAKDTAQEESLFSSTYSRIFNLMIPCTFAILALATPTLHLLFARGSFSSAGISSTTFCLYAYGLGLLPRTLVILYSTLYYARSDFRTPTIAALLSVGLNLLLNSLFYRLGPAAIALSTSISALFNFFLLQKFSRKAPPCLNLILICTLALSLTHLVAHFIPLPTRDFLSQLLYFTSLSSIFLLSVAPFAKRNAELNSALSLFR